MELLQAIRSWIIAGSCLLGAAATLFCIGAWFYTSPRWRTLFSTLNRQFRSLPPFGKLVAIVFLATFIVKGSTKTNNAPPPSPPPGGMDFDGGLQMQPESGEFSGPRLTTNQYRAGFALVRVATNAAPWFTVPSNAVLHAPWTRYGVAEDTFWIPATNWAFILGTNAVVGLHVSSSGTLSFGWPKGSPRVRELPDGSELDFLAPLQTSIGIAPPAGRFWHAPTPSNSLLLTWQDVHANRDTNFPVSFQSELFANGDFTFRYDFSSLKPQASILPTTNFVVGAQHNGGGETYAFGDTNCLVNGLELRWRAFGLLDPDIDDHDGDGLSTYDEVMIYDSDPRLPDTDLDGLPDAIEVLLGTSLRERDTDGDGIPDGSDPDPLVPNAADADGDGLPDAWEIFRFGSTNATDSAAADSDTDGFGNLAEMLIGSDPAFAVCAVSASEGAHTFTWTDLPGATGYTLSVASNGMQVWSCATNAGSLTLADAFPAGDCTLAVVSSGGVTSRTAQISFATPAAPNLTAWRIAAPFALVPPAADGVILERTFNIARDGGWQQFFVSSSPDGAAAWSLEHLRLDWSDSAGASGSATASPSGDSLRLSLSTNSPQVLTIRLVATGTNVLARSPKALHLLGWSPAIDPVNAGGAVLVPTPDGPVLAAVTDLGGGTTAASFTVDRGGRPCNTPPAPEELAQQANPFAADSGAEFTGSYGASGELTGGALLADDPGIFPLPGPGGGYAPEPGGGGIFPLSGTGGGYAPAPDGGATQPSSPAAPSGKVALIAPIVTQLHDHRGGCPYDGSDDYPFDSTCLRAAWLNAGGGAGESTGLTVSLGSEALNAFFTVTVNGTEGCEYMWQGDETSADVEIAMAGSTVWEQVVDREPSWSFGCAHLWEAECGGCGDCADGDCDGVEGDSLGSLRFRVPLGYTGHKQLAGFLWFVMESPQAVTPGLFQIDAAPGVALTHGNPGGTLSRALCDAPGGRDIVITAISGGVRLSIKDAGTTGEEFSWTITGTGGDVTFMRQDNASPANTLRQTTYSYSSGVWTCADHLAGASESLEATDYPPDDEQDAWEKSELHAFTAAGQILSSSWKMRTLIGKGEAAAWRETGRSEWDGHVSSWRNTTMSYWQDNLNPLVNGMPKIRISPDGSWEYRQYDARGRETLRAEPLDWDSAPYVFFWNAPSFAVSNGAVFFWPFDAVVTTSFYEPPAGDSAAWQDSRRPRETRRYAVKNGVFTLTAREWNVFSRGTNDGWPTLTRTAVRAATAGAAYGDTANARSVSVSVVEDADDVPVLMRGRPLREEEPNGTLRTWSYLYGDNDCDGTNDELTVTARTGTTALPDGLPRVSTYTTEQLDAVFGRLLERKTYLYTGGSGDPELEGESRQYDAKGRHIRSDFSDGGSEENIWNCCRLEASQGRDGSYREYMAIPGEDHWSAVAETSLGSLPGAAGRYPVAESFTDALGRETNSVRAVWLGGGRDPAYAPLQTRTEYPFGTGHYRVVTDPLGVQTVSRSQSVIRGWYRLVEETFSAGVTNRSTMIPGAAPIEERFWRDPVSGDARNLLRRTETAWTSNGNAITTTLVSRNGGPAVNETVSESDFLGRVIASSRNGASGVMLVTSNFYDGNGRLVRTRNPDGSSVVHAYDALGKQAAVIRIGAGQTLQFDPQSFALADVVALDAYVIDETAAWKEYGDLGLSAHGVPSAWWNCSASVSHLPGQGAATTSVTRVQITGLSPASLSRVVATDMHGARAMTVTAADTYEATVTTLRLNLETDTAESSVSLYGRAIGGTDATVAETAYAYDGFARQSSVTRTAGGRTLHVLSSYHPDGTPSSSVQVCGGVTYTNAWSTRQPLPSPAGAYAVTETDPLGNQTVRQYDAGGDPYHTGGAAYPTAIVRDADGRQAELRTWRDEAGQPDTTRWFYDHAGLMTNKVHADGLGPAHAYLPDGRPAARTWARGVTTSYGYADTGVGRVGSADYSDGTPSVTNTYDLAGRLTRVEDGTGSRTFSYDALGRLTVETNALAVIERVYDELGRDAGYDLDLAGGQAASVRYGYDAIGRHDAVTFVCDGVTNVFRYTYLEDSMLLSGMTNGCGVGWSRAYEPCRDLVAAVSNHADAVPFSTFDYANDAAGRRTRRVDDGVLTNMFFYNRRSEVTGTVMGARAYSYGYDGIGNRLAATNDGVGTAYLANLLNQYTNILRASALPHETSPAYDDDGNMLTCGPWAYSWDAENRLTAVFSNGTLVVSNAYDYMSRRVLKTTAATITHFVWDNWNIVAEIAVDRQTVATNLTRYVWGLDLSGTLQGAGGVGGLLAVIRPDGAFYPCCDANGNITDYVNAAGTVVAHYEYSPFGEITAQSGILADTFVFLFSTKYFEIEAGFYDYGRRFYDPQIGRWLSRDPVQEMGGLNLNQFVRNDPIRLIDYLGREPVTSGKPVASTVDFKKCVKWHSEVQYETYVYVPMHLMLPIPRRHAVYWALPQALSGSAPARRYRTAARDDACYFEARKLTVYAEPTYGFDATGDCRVRDNEGRLRYEPMISITREGGSPRWEPTWSDFRMLWRYPDGSAPGTLRHCDYRFYGATEARLVVHRKIRVLDADDDVVLDSLNFQMYATPIGDPPPPPSER